MFEYEVEYKNRSRLFEEIVLKSWWVILFLFLATFGYEQTSFQKQKETNALLQELRSLAESKKLAENRQDELLLQLESREDSRWIEIVLMNGLGLVPEGATKIYFTNSPYTCDDGRKN